VGSDDFVDATQGMSVTPTIEAWASGREPVPLEMWKELREATRLHYLKLADLDSEIVRAFDDAYQRAMAGKR
jgi:hypothetical protein